MPHMDIESEEFSKAISRYNNRYNSLVYRKLTKAIHDKEYHKSDICYDIVDCAYVLCSMPVTIVSPLIIVYTTEALLELDDSKQVYNLFLEWLSLFV